MTLKLVRKMFSYIGVNSLSDEDALEFISLTKLDRLPPHLIVLLSTILPVIEIIVKRLVNESIDWGDLTKDV